MLGSLGVEADVLQTMETERDVVRLALSYAAGSFIYGRAGVAVLNCRASEVFYSPLCCITTPSSKFTCCPVIEGRVRPVYVLSNLHQLTTTQKEHYLTNIHEQHRHS